MKNEKMEEEVEFEPPTTVVLFAFGKVRNRLPDKLDDCE